MPTENTAVCRECGRHYELPGSPSCGHSQAPPPDSPLGQLLSSFKLRGEPSAALLDELAQEKSARADVEAKLAAAQDGLEHALQQAGEREQALVDLLVDVAAQQAMPDDSWREQLRKIKAPSPTPEPHALTRGEEEKTLRLPWSFRAGC